ncbi:MAG TPA: M20 family metallopeptidase [Limnochordia bacterium]
MNPTPAPPEFSKEAAAEILSALVAIPSLNPFGDSARSGPEYTEGRVADWIAERLSAAGCQVTRQWVLPGRPNVLACLPGRDRTRTLLLETHMDTVQPATGMRDPFTPVRRNERIYGLGACDAKASLTAMILAMEWAAAGPPPPTDVLFAAVVDEEYGFRGVRHLIASGVAATAGVVGEPTECRIVIAHKGCLRWKVETRGRAAHASRPDEGVSAIRGMCRLIAGVEEGLAAAWAERAHPLTGPPTFNVGTIRGGLQANIVADRCEIDVDRRLIPGETSQGALAEFEAHARRAVAEMPGLEVVIHPPYLDDLPMALPADAPIVEEAKAAVIAAAGEPDVVGAPYGTDASKLTAAGIDTIVLGPGSITDAHSASESISLEQLVLAARIYAALVARGAPASA